MLSKDTLTCHGNFGTGLNKKRKAKFSMFILFTNFRLNYLLLKYRIQNSTVDIKHKKPNIIHYITCIEINN